MKKTIESVIKPVNRVWRQERGVRGNNKEEGKRECLCVDHGALGLLLLGISVHLEEVCTKNESRPTRGKLDWERVERAGRTEECMHRT